MIVSSMEIKVLVLNKKKHCDEVFTVGGNIIEIADEYMNILGLNSTPP